MKEVGLTVGGFYKHFDSREDLVVEALRSALGSFRRQAKAAASGGSPLIYANVVDNYLSEAHRDHPVQAVRSARWQERSHAAVSEPARS
jgi:TetR/AcrR family transcriptional regulator, transcriptional repressor for nem operon